MEKEYKFEDFENQFKEIEKEQTNHPYITNQLEIKNIIDEYESDDIKNHLKVFFLKLKF